MGVGMEFSQNGWILLCFVLYIQVILAFSIVYNHIYKKRSDSFVFQRNTLESRKSYVSETIKYELPRLRIAMNILGQALSKAGKKSSYAHLTESRAEIDIGDYSCIIELHTFISPGDDPIQSMSLKVCKSSKDIIYEQLISINPSPANYINGHRDRISWVIEKINKKISEHEDTLCSFKDPFPRVWRYLDFLYFSVITQTTVGYGDILPNRTLIRCFVVIQVIVGLVLLGIIINLSI